jgi:hypothetical protein
LAQIKDENANDLRSSHGLDAASVGDWVDKTHSNVVTDNFPVVPIIVDKVISPKVSIPVPAPEVVSDIPTDQRMCCCKTKSIVFHCKKNYGADVSVPVTTSGQQILIPNHVVAVPPEVTVPDGIQTNARVNADKPGMAAFG